MRFVVSSQGYQDPSTGSSYGTLLTTSAPVLRDNDLTNVIMFVPKDGQGNLAVNKFTRDLHNSTLRPQSEYYVNNSTAAVPFGRHLLAT
jgi:hypothetical protein